MRENNGNVKRETVEISKQKLKYWMKQRKKHKNVEINRNVSELEIRERDAF